MLRLHGFGSYAGFRIPWAEGLVVAQEVTQQRVHGDGQIHWPRHRGEQNQTLNRQAFVGATNGELDSARERLRSLGTATGSLCYANRPAPSPLRGGLGRGVILMSRMYRDREQRDFARQLRNEPTEAEKRLWHFLRAGKLGVKFRRQAAIGLTWSILSVSHTA